MPEVRKKLIEVSIPLEAINKASAREKSIRHGHPSTLHLWWARRPLAACRAVLFAQLVDDPSAWPDRFPTDEAQDVERQRLHKVISDMVPWEASNDERILNNARWEISRSVAWGLGEEPPPQQDTQAILDYLQTKAPPVYDPFSGGGSIPLEAQRLGLRAYGSDLNPVAVLIGKALVEIPPKFAGQPPVNPEAQAKLKRGGKWNGKAAQGLAEDVRYYGQWMRDEAEKRIGDLYPKTKLPDGSEATVIAWLWARTVRSPDPLAKGAMVPLVSSLMLSTKPGKKAWVEVVIDEKAQDGWRFEVKTGAISKAAEDKLKEGTIGRSGGGTCSLTGAAMPFDYMRSVSKSGGMNIRLMAVVAKKGREKYFLSPSETHEEVANSATPEWEPDILLPEKALGFRVQEYGMLKWSQLYTQRQLTTLSTLNALVREALEAAFVDAKAAQIDGSDLLRLHAGGRGAHAYADAIATYLAMCASKMAMFVTTQSRWRSGDAKTAPGFGRHALPMVWDFAEINPFGGAGGDWNEVVKGGMKAVEEHCGKQIGGKIECVDARRVQDTGIVISTDPPYYDNIGYADLSDYFYVWLRHSSKEIWPELFRRLEVPKNEELIATPFRHKSSEAAEAYFIEGMGEAIYSFSLSSRSVEPIAIYYAFKQSEASADGVTSAGWASFLQSVVDGGLLVDGTWPLRTEGATRLIASDANALASSIVLVCRRRLDDASTITRADFIRLLRRELPDAIDDIRKAGVGPVDMQQSVIGPGMGVFSRHARVLEDDDSAMSVKTALAIINRVWGEIENEADATYDAETQVALAWFASYGFDAKPSGDLITLANAKNVPQQTLFASGVFSDLRGRAQLTPREQLPADWTPQGDRTLTVWECVQHAARTLRAEEGGAEAAARLVAEMPPHMAADARKLSDRLFQIATDKGWAQEALIYNELSTEWLRLSELAGRLATAAPTTPAQAALDLGGAA